LLDVGMRSPYDPVNLLAHEAAEGHMLLEHVKRPDEYLAWRAHELGSASTFRDERAATALTQRALRAEAEAVADWLARAPKQDLTLRVDLHEVVGYGYNRGRAKPVTTSVVLVVLRPMADGRFRVHTAYPMVAR
jgi:hypothetical protein